MAEIRAIGENADRHEQNFSEKEFALIKELVQARMEQKQNLEYESFDGYELPPRTQFSMLKKPAVSIIYGKLTFNMASIRLFEGVKYILTIVNTKKKKPGFDIIYLGAKKYHQYWDRRYTAFR